MTINRVEWKVWDGRDSLTAAAEIALELVRDDPDNLELMRAANLICLLRDEAVSLAGLLEKLTLAHLSESFACR